MDLWETIKNLVLTTLGHSISGGVIAAAYEAVRLVQSGVSDWKILGSGLILGGCIGFFRALVESLEGMKTKDTKSAKIFGKTKSWGRYFIY